MPMLIEAGPYNKNQRIGSIMKPLITKGKLIAATIALIMMAAIFLAGARHGYDLGFVDGENRTNGWWIDKKARYYESGEVKKKQLQRKHNHI